MKGYQGTQLRVVQADTDSGKRNMQEPYLSSSMTQSRETQETRSVEQKMKRHMQSTRRPDQERRMARVEELRELVRAGRYHVDSMSLAQSMLDNETHFTELSQQ